MQTDYNKIEEEFKVKLNAREITPTDAAWDRLDAMLSVTEEKKTRPIYNWLYIAAAILGICLMATLFFNDSVETGPMKNQVVIEEKAQENREETDPANNMAPQSNQNEAVAESENTKEEGEKSQKNPGLNANPILNRKVLGNQDNAVAQTQNKESIEKATSPKPIENLEPVSVDVDKMLADAEKSTQQPTAVKLKVDPNSLLSQVDGELELSFREKVIKSVSKNYKNVKVALANRNLE